MRVLLTAWLLIAAAPVEAHEGWGIVSTPGGPIFFTDTLRGIVWRLDPGGAVRDVLRDTHTHALVTIGDGSVYGTHRHPSEPFGGVWRLDADGRLHTLLPPTRDIALGLRSFLIDSDGTMYSGIRWAPADRFTLLRRRVDGIIERVAGGFSSIDGMAWAPDGAIFVTDGPYLKRVTLTGDVETLGGGPLSAPRGSADSPWRSAATRRLIGVTTDGSGGAFVADFAGRRILDVGRLSGVAVDYVSNAPWSPTGVARDAEGLLVLEHLQGPWSILGRVQVGPYLRVRRLGLKGRVDTLAVLWGTWSWIAAAALLGLTGAVVAWRLRANHVRGRP
ncbi:MAG: hypothetical protein ACRD26_22350 [Vicinamibacterales bacterium]